MQIDMVKVEEVELDEMWSFVGKKSNQRWLWHAIERKHLTLRTRIKRLARRTICFSKLEKMHDIVIGFFINRYEFGVAL